MPYRRRPLLKRIRDTVFTTLVVVVAILVVALAVEPFAGGISLNPLDVFHGPNGNGVWNQHQFLTPSK